MCNCYELQNHRRLSQTLSPEWKLARQGEAGPASAEASAELVKTSLDMILAQTRAGGATALVIGVILGAMFIPAGGGAVYAGTKLATSTLLSHRVVELLADRERWRSLPGHTREWLELQAEVSRLPEPGRLLIESFRRGERAHLCLYGFAGRNAHQTLGLLLTRRMEAADPGPGAPVP